jgi:hypothetical protein
MPRFYSRAVSDDIKAQTGIQFASVDWQPCGHKDIVICHGESHYDFHLYYVPEAELSSLEMCEIGSKFNPKLPVCTSEKKNPANAAYFKLIDHDMPMMASISSMDSPSKTQKNFDFCVDPSSAILRSGIHYGDGSETLGEWKHPVTIIGSHDCRLMFFEPMISWKWISGTVKDIKHWPSFQVSDIQYNNKTFEALPNSWSIKVSDGCKDANKGPCRITVTVEGTKCPSGGCTLERKCGNMKDCMTNAKYTGAASPSNMVNKASTSTSLPRANSLSMIALVALLKYAI